ncbi:MAG: restriction endonuclease [Candidatus Altiarchaeota archaeon]
MGDIELSYDFENVIRSFITKMGFEVESVERIDDGGMDFISKTTNPMGGRVTSVIRASQSTRPVSMEDAEDLYDSILNHQAVRGAYITLSSFSHETEEYVRDKPISLINKYQLLESIEKRGLASDKEFMLALDQFGLAEKHFQGFEQSFVVSRSEREIKDYFESKTVRKGLFGSKKTNEVPVKIVLRYAPISVFKTVSRKYVGSETQELRVVEKRDFLFVNLNNLDLYYIRQKRKKNSVELSFNRSDIIYKIMTLPEEPKDHLMDLLEHGDLPLSDIEGKDLSILKNKKIINVYEGKKGASSMTDQAQQALEGMLETVNLIASEISSGISSMGEESPSKPAVEKPKPKKVEAQVNMPHTDGGIYDIWKYLLTEEGVSPMSEMDTIEYSSGQVSSLLGKIMKGGVSREGIIFMPYHRAKYVDSKTGNLTKYEILLSPKFKGAEAGVKKRPSEKKEIKTVRKSQIRTGGVAGDFQLIK